MDNIKVVVYIFCFTEKLALELGYGFPFSTPKHVCLKVSSKIFVSCQVGYLTVTEKEYQNKTKGCKKNLLCNDCSQ